jgi:hypothetical protein
LIRSLNLRSISSNYPATRFLAELDGEIDVLRISTAAGERRACAAFFQDQEGVSSTGEPKCAGNLFHLVISLTFPGMVHYEDRD